LNHFRQLKTL